EREAAALQVLGPVQRHDVRVAQATVLPAVGPPPVRAWLLRHQAEQQDRAGRKEHHPQRERPDDLSGSRSGHSKDYPAWAQAGPASSRTSVRRVNRQSYSLSREK